MIAVTLYLIYKEDDPFLCSSDLYSFHLLNYVLLLLIIGFMLVFTDILIIYFLKTNKDSTTTTKLLRKKRKVMIRNFSLNMIIFCLFFAQNIKKYSKLIHFLPQFFEITIIRKTRVLRTIYLKGIYSIKSNDESYIFYE